MKKVRKSLADVTSFWSSILHEPMILTLLIVYAILCVIYFKMGIDTQSTWVMKVLPEIMGVGAIVMYYTLQGINKIFDFFSPWPKIGKGLTGIMKKPSMFAKIPTRPVYFILTFNGLLGKNFGSTAMQNVLQRKREQALLTS